MAIQRLHRKGYYSNGSRRIMNAEEFANTLSYCLGFINVESSTRFYEKLFSEVDLDYDGFISYEDYFVFLKEYFGSKSYAASQTNIEPPPPKEQKKPEETFVDGNGETNNERFAKLIYSQFKILVMDKDKNRNLAL